MLDKKILFRSAGEPSSPFREGQATAVQVVEAHLRQVRRWNPRNRARREGRPSLYPPSTALARALLVGLLCAGSADAQQAEERTTRTTRVVTTPDGTTTTTITEVRTSRDGRTTTRTTTRTQGAPARAAVPTPTPPPPPIDAPDEEPAQSPLHTQHGAPGAAEALALHNRERALVGKPALSWDAGLASLAQDWAHQLCGKGRGARGLRHRPVRPGGPGENLWQGMATGGQVFPVASAIRDWAAEKRYYDPRTGGCRGGVCGHYTQMIWGTTTRVGCAAATCPSGAFTATVWVCNYSPAGNILGLRP